VLDLSARGARLAGDLAHRRSSQPCSTTRHRARDGFATFSLIDLFHHANLFHLIPYV
jgi:hypothetical protein